MSSVYVENKCKCPVCESTNTGFDLNCNTSEQSLECNDCGYAGYTRVVTRPSGKEVWEVTEQFPMDENGRMRGRNPEQIRNLGLGNYNKLGG